MEKELKNKCYRKNIVRHMQIKHYGQEVNSKTHREYMCYSKQHISF